MTRLVATGARAAAREVPGRDVAAFLADQTMQMAPTFPADVVIRAPAAHVIDRLGMPPPGTLTDNPDGTSRWLASPDTLEWHTLRLASIGLPFQISSPAELVAYVRATAALFQRATTAEPDPTAKRPPRAGRRDRPPSPPPD
ncbi:hypothetical protein KBX50_26265 [Micromonospora sp. C51]|nr:hypothetical protein [Micromonospora sp. C51]